MAYSAIAAACTARRCEEIALVVYRDGRRGIDSRHVQLHPPERRGAREVHRGDPA